MNVCVCLRQRQVVGDYIAELELKAVEQLQKIHEAQLINYLKATGMNVGILINFTHPKAEIKRMVLNLPEGHDSDFDDKSSSK